MKLDLNKLWLKAVDVGNLEAVKLLIESGVDPSIKGNWAITWASNDGHKDIGELLVKDKRVNPADRGNDAILWAAHNKYKEIVRLLIKHSKVRDSLSQKEIKKYENM